MQVHFSGHNTVSVDKVSERKIRAIEPDEGRGYFHFSHDAQIDPRGEILTVIFTATIYINEALSNSEASEVEAHERRHFNDFHNLAIELKESIESALENENDPEIIARLRWFYYDNCVAMRHMHNEEERSDSSRCIQPDSSRPM